jgi:crotonobetainyl-CoA:carnitine CoA-transferase CaiB-like acyl-CoA transferase
MAKGAGVPKSARSEASTEIRSPHPVERAGTPNADSAGPLSWLRVVDLTDLRGAMCARILADLGADVVLVERKGTARYDPDSTAYRYRHANKRGAVMDLEEPEDRSKFEALLATADVLVENLDTEERQVLGLSPDVVSESHPRLVHVALADLGLSGPRSNWHLEALPALAASGGLHQAGFPEFPPCNAPGFLAHDCASIYGAAGAVAAILDRARHGRGQLVEVSVQEAALAGITPWSIAWEDYQKINPLLPADGKRNADGNYWVLPASDGWIRGIIGPRHWQGFLKLLRSPAVLTGPEWNDTAFRLMNGDVVRLVSQDALTDRTREQLFEEALSYGTSIGVINTVNDFVTHPQTRFRGYFARADFPKLEGLPFATHPVHLSHTPARITRPAPSSGADDRGEFAARDDAVAFTALESKDGPLLAGVRVVEFGVAAVVPELCGVLSELGAEVIKVESASHPDLLRGAGENLNRSFAFNTECRGRKSVALDLSTPEGRKLALRLCASADIVAENNRGGVLDGLGLGYEDVRAQNPDVIYVSSQGYGKDGPLGTMPAYGPLNLCFSGMHQLWNHPEAPYPCGTTLNHPDSIAGKLLAVSVLAALHHRAFTGEGQYLEAAQTEVAAYLIGEVYLDAERAGAPPVPLGNRHATAAPHGVYPTAGEDQWIAIAVMSDAEWQRFCKVAEWEDDPQLRTLDARLKLQGKLDQKVADWTQRFTAEDAAALLQANSISAMPVMGPRDHHADPHLAERQFIVHLHHPEVGDERQVGNPIRMSRLEQRTAQSAPCLGADTEEILVSELGLSKEDVRRLQESGIAR